MKFKYKPIKYNSSSRENTKIEWIVIHDTANSNPGADAEAHFRYFLSKRKASAHYFVDDKGIIQIVGDSRAAWHCGENQGYGRALNGCTNSNSIGIELCINSDGDYEAAYKNLVELTKNLMKKFNISIEKVCRHYDVSRKICPGSFFDKGLWEKFKAEIGKPVEWTIDLSKDSTFGEKESAAVPDVTKDTSDWAEDAWKWGVEKGLTDGTNPQGACTREQVITMLYRALGNDKAVEKPDVSGTAKARHFTMGDYEIIETTADNIRIERTSLKPLSVDGINGTFYNLKGSEIYGLAMQDGKEIETNSYVTNFHSLKRGTIYYDGKSLHHDMVYNAKTEIKDFIKWAISGISLYPTYDSKSEGFIGPYADVLRATKHTALGYKGDKVYLIASGKSLTLENFRNGLLNSSISFDGLINLDGGGSTQMSFGGKKLISSVRALNHCIRLLNI
jgi:N-acetyl-anhydromuramyl-L-alanine amidase AmpD